MHSKDGNDSMVENDKNSLEIPEGIGPHEGKELELMLAGKKPLAMFSDVFPSTLRLLFL